MGRVIDSEKAKGSVCTCYKMDPDGPDKPDNLLCFTEGIIGTLRDSQDRKYCGENKSIILSGSNFQEQFKKFRMMGYISDVCAEGEVSSEEFPSCLKDGAGLLERGKSPDQIEKELGSKYNVTLD